jgi:hypothetical protein
MFWDRSDAIISLCSLIIDLEQAKNTEFLSPDQRLALAVLMPSEVVERMLPGLLTLCESATFGQSKLTVFSFIFRPFWNDETFWKVIFGIVVNDSDFNWETRDRVVYCPY